MFSQYIWPAFFIHFPRICTPTFGDIFTARSDITLSGTLFDCVTTTSQLESPENGFINKVSSWVRDYFVLLICDEVHLLKNVNSMMHRIVDYLAAAEKLFLIGTPMINRERGGYDRQKFDAILSILVVKSSVEIHSSYAGLYRSTNQLQRLRAIYMRYCHRHSSRPLTST